MTLGHDPEALPFYDPDSDSKPLVERLERLFGRYWQAALDRAGILSRRRARELGAGDEAAPSLLATVEFLERTPLHLWPTRWDGLGKHSDRCPGLTSRPDALLNGKLDPQVAITFWDRATKGGRPSYYNVAVGVFPTGFGKMPQSHPEKVAYLLWNRQWTDAHGGDTLAAKVRTKWTSPAGIVASFIARDLLEPQEAERTIQHLRARVFGFDAAEVRALANEYRHKMEADSQEDEDDEN